MPAKQIKYSQDARENMGAQIVREDDILAIIEK